jgi:tetratricopeptide (TPR) repeat protein
VSLLTSLQQEVLAAASVQGEEFVADTVAEVLRIERRDVIRELSGPTQKELRLVSAIGTQDVGGRQLARYRFRHNLVQDYLYRQLDEVERGDLHGATGCALEKVHAADPAAAAVTLATHFTAAGDWPRAIRYRWLAAQSAARAFAHDQVVDHLQQALTLDEGHPGAGNTLLDRAAVREWLGDELVLVRQWAAATASYDASLALVESTDRLVRARLLRKFARVQERQSQYAETASLLESALAELGEPDPSMSTGWWSEWIDVQIASSWVHYWQGDAGGMEATCARLEPVIDDRGTWLQCSQFHAANVRRGLRQTRYRPDETTLLSAERAVAALNGHPDEFLMAETVFLLGFTQLWAERHAEAEASFERTLALARRFGDSTHRLRALVYRSIGRRRCGDIVRVGELNDAARELMKQIGSDEYTTVVLAQDAWLAWRRGDLAGARALLEGPLSNSIQGSTRLPFQWLFLWVALAMRTTGGDLSGAADAAAAMLRPPLARQDDDVEAQLMRIVSTSSSDDDRLRQELETGVQAARAAGYL